MGMVINEIEKRMWMIMSGLLKSEVDERSLHTTAESQGQDLHAVWDWM